MKRLTLIALTAAALSLTAVPAIAQSSYSGGATNNSYNNNLSSFEREAAKEARKAKREARKLEKARKKQAKADAAAKKANSSATNAETVKGHSSATNANSVKDHSSATKAKAVEAYPVNEPKTQSIKKANVGLPTNCPPATTPQPNGTCMLN